MHLSFRWPFLPDGVFREEFIVGAWHPTSDLRVGLEPLPPGERFATVAGRNWFLLSSTSPFLSGPKGLVHLTGASSPLESRSTGAIGFRGYLLEPPLHSWSAEDRIVGYWAEKHRCHNGVFAAVRIVEDGGTIELLTDAFGIAGLYYRTWKGVLLFSTNSRLLAFDGDELDRMAGRILLQCGSVYGNRTLTAGTSRVPAGTAITFVGRARMERRWFSFSCLPCGDEALTTAGLDEVEEAFQEAVERCLRLEDLAYVLPLSSGDDSRRILAAVHSRGVPFQAITVRARRTDNRDLDGYWPSVMATALDFPHRVAELPVPEEFARQDRLRRALLDGHACEHSWFLALNGYLPDRPSLLFDGLGGDVFGNTGFADKSFHVAEESLKPGMIVNRVLSDTHERILNPWYWPSLESVRAELLEYLRDVPEGRNMADLAFLLLRTRSGPGMCCQRLVPAGHVTVYPYFDLSYARLTLRFDPVSKIPPHTLQAQCLARFWPRYYAFPGTRRPPPEMRPGSPQASLREALWLACYRQLKNEAGCFSRHGMRGLLTPRALALSALPSFRDGFANRLRWWLEPLLTLLAREATKRACWAVANET